MVRVHSGLPYLSRYLIESVVRIHLCLPAAENIHSYAEEASHPAKDSTISLLPLALLP